MTDEHKQRISRSLTGRKLSDSHRKNVSRSIKKWWSKPENKLKMSIAHGASINQHGKPKGWHHTPEARRKISQSRIGKPTTVRILAVVGR